MKLDLHVHTSEVSGCGRVPAAEMARLYHEAGYDGIVITDHLIAGKNQEMPMPERAAWYLSGYRAAKAEGEKLGLTVLLGAEARMAGGDEDFLLFGAGEDDIPWLMALLDGGADEGAFYQAVHATGRMLLIQAHPFRQGLRQAPLEQLDGIEVYNGHPDHESHNELALARALQGREGFILQRLRRSQAAPHRPGRHADGRGHSHGGRAGGLAPAQPQRGAHRDAPVNTAKYNAKGRGSFQDRGPSRSFCEYPPHQP